MPPSKTQFHVTLKYPIRVKLNDNSTAVIAFDAERTEHTDQSMDCLAFAVHTLYFHAQPTVSKRFTGTVIIPIDNIAGRTIQPFSTGKIDPR